MACDGGFETINCKSKSHGHILSATADLTQTTSRLEKAYEVRLEFQFMTKTPLCFAPGVLGIQLQLLLPHFLASSRLYVF